MVWDEVDKNLQLQLMGTLDEAIKIVKRAVLGIDVEVVGHVIAVVLLRRGKERCQPDRIDPEVFQMLESRGDRGQVANSVVVGVGEAADVDLIENRTAPPWSGQPELTDVPFHPVV